MFRRFPSGILLPYLVYLFQAFVVVSCGWRYFVKCLSLDRINRKGKYLIYFKKYICICLDLLWVVLKLNCIFKEGGRGLTITLPWGTKGDFKQVYTGSWLLHTPLKGITRRKQFCKKHKLELRTELKQLQNKEIWALSKNQCQCLFLH